MNCLYCKRELSQIDVFVLEEVKYSVEPPTHETASPDWIKDEIVEGTEERLTARCPHCEKTYGTWLQSGKATTPRGDHWGKSFTEWLEILMEELGEESSS